MIERLWALGYRNLAEFMVTFDPQRPVCVIGANNQGKTNFLELLHMCMNCGWDGSIQWDHSIHHSEQKAAAKCHSVEGGESIHSSMVISKGKKPIFTVNNDPVRRLRKGTLSKSFFMNADIIRLFQDQPDGRRKQLDMFCRHLFPDYAALYTKYDRVLKQKNHCLKNHPFSKQVPLFNEQLVSYACQIMTFRLEALHRLMTHVPNLLTVLGLDSEYDVSFEYLTTRLDAAHDMNDYEALLSRQLELDREKEGYLGYSLVGPHRDDIDVQINHHKMADFYSRGIHRMVAIMFQLAQLLVIEQLTGRFPVVLLDEPFVEIDREKKQSVIQWLINYTQCFYAGVDENDVDYFNQAQVFTMTEGVLTERS